MSDIVKMVDIVKALRAVDHNSVEDCFMLSPLFAKAADEIERLRTRLAEAEKVIEPFADVGELLAAETEGFLPDDVISLVFGGTDYELGVNITHEQFRAARAWKEASNG